MSAQTLLEALPSKEVFSGVDLDRAVYSFLLMHLSHKELKRLLKKAVFSRKRFSDPSAPGHAVWYPHYLQIERELEIRIGKKSAIDARTNMDVGGSHENA